MSHTLRPTQKFLIKIENKQQKFLVHRFVIQKSADTVQPRGCLVRGETCKFNFYLKANKMEELEYLCRI